ncbi:MAG: mandelate racemase/muconate lactonizing enzyme family protein [Cellvibrionaceae bacterium]
MKIKSLTIFNLKIPFNKKHAHDAKRWPYGESIIVKVEDELGNVGYGEGRPCPNLTGETVVSATQMIAYVFWPAIASFLFPSIDEFDDAFDALEAYQKVRVFDRHPGVREWNVAWCAVEMALVDCALRRANLSFGEWFPPKRHILHYIGVITAHDPAKIAELSAERRIAGFSELRLKVTKNYHEQIAAARSVLGDDFSIILDANGHFDFDEGLLACKKMNEQYGIQIIEDPISRKKYRLEKFVEFCRKSSISIMADNWLVTNKDLKLLTQEKSASVFYLKLARCGGMYQTIKMAREAARYGVYVAIGAHVGETGMLSIVGRHMGSVVPEILFMSGSAGIGRLKEDIIVEDVRPGKDGLAEISRLKGLGYSIKEDLVNELAIYKKVLG